MILSFAPGTVQFIEADIILGSLIDDDSHALQPVMGHPPNTVSDITLESFLSQVLAHNRQHSSSSSNATKGVKLDFKSIEVFRGSLAMLQSLWPAMDFPVWINADILAGPVWNTETTPVDPRRFFDGAKQLPGAVLSIGWTTLWSRDHREGNYTGAQIAGMLAAIEVNNITLARHPITFPVRAGIAANSTGVLNELLGAVNKTNECTLTVWSSPDDYVDVDALRRLIFSVGLDRVYVDVPAELSARLDLANAPAGASGLMHLGLVTTVIMVLMGLILS